VLKRAYIMTLVDNVLRLHGTCVW